MKSDGSKAPITLHSPLGITYHPNEKAKATADCLESHVTSYGLYDKNHQQQVEARIQALLASVEYAHSANVRPYDIQKLVKH
jgi:hypothetical protein